MATVIRAGKALLGKGALRRVFRGGPNSQRDTNRTTNARDDTELNALIQGEIIPRLLISHPEKQVPRRITGGRAISSEEASRFAQLPLELDADELLQEVDNFLARGIAVESIFVDLLAPAARRLGQYWEEDRCDFVDVTMGLWRLQEVMRDIAQRYGPQIPGQNQSRSALFSPMPGDQHSFGALMIEEIFARAGWQSEVLIDPTRRELIAKVAERPIQLVGLTVSCDCPSREMANLITAIRAASNYSEVQVLLGGRMVNSNPELVAEVGADGTAPDARSALALAERKILGAQRLDLLEP